MSLDRLERRLPEVLTELSLPRTPDYIDDLLVRTARMPQRPGWTLLERWFPVSTYEATLAGPRPTSLRPLIGLAIVAALIAASLAIYFGTQKHLPPLYGPARNGLLVATLATGELVAVDPSTNATKTLLRAPDICCAMVSPDGQRISYIHIPAGGGGDPTSLVIADLNGSTTREIPAAVLSGLVSGEWAPTSDKLLLTTSSGPVILDVATGATTQIDVPYDVMQASWIGTSGDVLLTSRVDNDTLLIARLPAGELRAAPEVTRLHYAVDAPIVSPDGTKFLYFIWGPEEPTHGSIHVFDFVSGDDAVTEEGLSDGLEWENPIWSPDSSSIAALRYESGASFRVAVLPAAGGTPVVLGPVGPNGTGARLRFSPDGASVLVTYGFNGATWLLPISGAEGLRLAWADSLDDIAWQRLAP